MSIIGSVYSYFRRVFTVSAPGHMQTSFSDTGESVEEIDVLNLSTAWSCVRLLSGTIASLPLTPYRDVGNGHKVPATDHPLYRLLKRAPNDEQTVMDFWEGAVASIELKGNAVALKQRSVSGDIIGIAPLTWDHISITRDDDVLIYEYQGEKYSAADILHIRGFGGSPMGGLSTISYGVSTFGMAKAINRSSSKMFANGVRPSGILSSDKDITAEKMKEAQCLIDEKYAGAINAGRPMLLNGGLKWQALSINPDEAQMLESRYFSVEEVCRMFGVPPHMVGHTEKASSWGTGLEQQTLGFQKFALRPRLKKIETALEQQLLTPKDIADGISIEFNLDGLLRADTAARFSSYQIGINSGIYTRNEVRALEGLPPVDGGDIITIQMQNVPLGQNEE